MENTNKLVAMLNATFKPALAEGKYSATMKAYELVEKDSTSYVKFTFNLTDNNREVTDNRFEKGLGVMISHLRQQLGRENEEIIPTEFFDELIKNQTPFNIWIVKRVVNGVQRTNFNFLEPIQESTTTPSTIEVVDDDIEETTEESEE